MTYENYLQREVPPWLQGEVGRAFMGALAVPSDELVEKVKGAVKASFPQGAPSDALPKLAADLLTPRGPAEPEDAYRARLVVALDAWRWAGTRKGLREYALAPMGYTETDTMTTRQWGVDGPPSGSTADWSRVWVSIAEPHGFTQRVWDDGWTWQADGTQETFDSTATVADVARIRSVVDLWRSARDRVEKIIIVFGDDATLTGFILNSSGIPTFIAVGSSPTIACDGVG